MRYILTLLIGAGLVVLVIILLLRAIFGGDRVEEPQIELVDYANTNVIVRTTIDGPINANSEHEQIRIEVSQFSADIRIISGYQGRVVRSESYNNNSSAYANFLRALDLQGYTRGDDREELEDERGYCPTGRRYIFEIIDGSETLQRYWTTSCSSDEGSFRGERDDVLWLFRAQIPDYNDVTRGISTR